MKNQNLLLKNGENVKNHQMWDKFLDWILLKEL